MSLDLLIPGMILLAISTKALYMGWTFLACIGVVLAIVMIWESFD